MLYDEDYFIESLEDASCIYRFEETNGRSGQKLQFDDSNYKSGWFYMQQIIDLRDRSGYIDTLQVFGLLPETSEEIRIQHTRYLRLSVQAVRIKN